MEDSKEMKDSVVVVVSDPHSHFACLAIFQEVHPCLACFR